VEKRGGLRRFDASFEGCTRFSRRRHSNDLYMTLARAKYFFGSSSPIYEEAAPGFIASLEGGIDFVRKDI